MHVRKLVMPRGLRGLTYHPPRTGRYTVEVQAVDLLNHYTRVEPHAHGQAAQRKTRSSGMRP